MIIDNRSNRTNIAKVVKEFIFPKMKFITSSYELEYNKDDESVSQIVLNEVQLYRDSTMNFLGERRASDKVLAYGYEVVDEGSHVCFGINIVS